MRRGVREKNRGKFYKRSKKFENLNTDVCRDCVSLARAAWELNCTFYHYPKHQVSIWPLSLKMRHVVYSCCGMERNHSESFDGDIFGKSGIRDLASNWRIKNIDLIMGLHIIEIQIFFFNNLNLWTITKEPKNCYCSAK